MKSSGLLGVCGGALVVLAAAACVSANAADKKLFGVSWQHFNEERWAKYDKACMLDELKKFPDWDYIETDAQASAEKQTSDVETLITKGVSALAIIPYSTDSIKPAAAAAVANGIPTIGYDIQVEVPGVFYLSFDNAEVGRIEARGVLAVKPTGNYVYIKGSQTMDISNLVHGGQVEVLQPLIDSGKIKIVGDQYTDGWKPEVAQTNMEQILTANNDAVDAVVASNDGTAGGVVAALTSQGLVGKIPVSGQDGDIAALNRIAKGFQTVSAWKNSCDLGRQAVQVGVALASGTPADKVGKSKFCGGPAKVCQDAIELKPVAITRDNLNIMLDAGWLTKEQLCAGVDQVPETVHGVNPPPACK
ncbi:MAG: substrate-binding domain-containing protein [Bauldia sp.]